MRSRLCLSMLILVAGGACSPDGSPRRGPVGGPSPGKAAEALRPADLEPVELVGTIRHVAAEGGVYVLRTAEGRQYRLVELPEDFRTEGLAVRVEGRLHDDVLTEDMAGQALDIVRITRQ